MPRFKLAYSDALYAVVSGKNIGDAYVSLTELYPEIPAEEVGFTLAEALRDALRQGTKREDIDASWF